jgi:hypothetical protein
MNNWSVDVSKLKKDKEKYAIWRLEQMVNFGLGEDRFDIRELEKYWSKLNLDPNKKKYLATLIWPKQF